MIFCLCSVPITIVSHIFSSHLLTPYFPQTESAKHFDLAEPVPGPTTRALAEAARKHRVVILGSIFEKRADGIYHNTAVLIDSKGKLLGKYRKMHLFGYQSLEKRLLTPGKEIVAVKTPWGVAGLSTCYDLRFPEFYRKMVDLGVQIFLVAAAWPMARLSAWNLFNRTRALENLAFLFSCNCAGSDAGQQYGGHSALVEPLGNVIAEGDEGECYVSAEVDLELVRSVRGDFPALEDRGLR